MLWISRKSRKLFNPSVKRVVYGVLTVMFVLVSEFAGWPPSLAPRVKETHANGLLFSDGFESNDFSLWSSTGGAYPPSIVTSPVHGGTKAMLVDTSAGSGDGAAQVSIGPHPSGTLWARFYVYYTGTPSEYDSANLALYVSQYGSTESFVGMNTYSDNEFFVGAYSDGTVHYSSIGAQIGRWYRLEWRVLIDESSGEQELRIYDGDSTTPLDTILATGVPTATAGAGGEHFYKYSQGVNDGAITVTEYFDDVAIGNLDWIGPSSAPGGRQVRSRSDALSNSQPSATSNHTIAFTINNSLDTTGWGSGSGGDATDTLAITFPSGFNLTNVFCKDVDLTFAGTATSIAGYKVNRSTSTNCLGSATSWGLFIDSAHNALTFYTPTAVRTYVATGTQVTINIGTNATFQDTGSAWITNPSAAGVYTIAVCGTFGGSGNIPVSINSGVTVAATVAESLSLSVSSISALGCTADDGASVNSVSATGPLVAFGNLSANTFYQGCHDLQVSTNAGGGYSVAVQENHAMMTSNGLKTIPDTTCDAGLCTSASSGAWVTPTNYGLGHTCTDQVGHDCAGPYSSGTRFRPFANLAGGTIGPMLITSTTGTPNGSSTAITGVNARDLIVAIFNYETGAVDLTGISVSDAQGTYTQAVCQWSAGPARGSCIFYLPNAAAGTHTATISFSGAPSSWRLDLMAFDGIATVSPLDQAAGDLAGVSGSGDNSIGTINSQATRTEVLIGTMSTNTGQTCTKGSNVDTLVTGSVGKCLEYRIVSTNLTLPFTGYMGMTAGFGYAGAIASFRSDGSVGQVIMASSTPAIATGRVKYRLSVPASQAAGTYTNVITYTIMGTF